MIIQDIFKISLTSLVSIIVLFIVCRFAGQREIGQLSMFDYINSITIGSIAAELATDLEHWWQPLTATIVYGIVTVLIMFFNRKSIKIRHFVSGCPLILMQNGTLYQSNFNKAKINLNEFLAQCRIAGYFDLRDVQTAILETNGQISFLPKASSRPVTTSDLNLKPHEESLFTNLILDGKIQYQNLKKCKKENSWLIQQLDQHNIHDPQNIFLASCDDSGHLIIFESV